MNTTDLNSLWISFNDEWRDRFNQVRHVLNYFHANPHVAMGFNVEFVDVAQLESRQGQWLHLLDELENPIEKTFFKPYWVPVNHDRYDLFIDLSDPYYRLIHCDYLPWKPYGWVLIDIVPNMSDFILDADEGTLHYGHILANAVRKRDELFVSFLNEYPPHLHKFFGKPLIEQWELVNEDDEPVISFASNDMFVTLENVQPFSIGLFPPSLPIVISDWSFAPEVKNDGDFNHGRQVKADKGLLDASTIATIGDLLRFMRENRNLRFDYFVVLSRFHMGTYIGYVNGNLHVMFEFWPFLNDFIHNLWYVNGEVKARDKIWSDFKPSL